MSKHILLAVSTGRAFKEFVDPFARGDFPEIQKCFAPGFDAEICFERVQLRVRCTCRVERVGQKCDLVTACQSLCGSHGERVKK